MIYANWTLYLKQYSYFLLLHFDETYIFLFDFCAYRLRFKPLLEKASIGTETTCQISGDMFSVEIVLDAKESDSFGPVVIDVVVQQSDNALSDPVLLNMIRLISSISYRT